MTLADQMANIRLPCTLKIQSETGTHLRNINYKLECMETHRAVLMTQGSWRYNAV